jgi:hypothetical protein
MMVATMNRCRPAPDLLLPDLLLLAGIVPGWDVAGSRMSVRFP